MEKELRNIDLEYRYDEESRTVEGYAIVFNSLSNDLGGFKEMIEPRALDGILEQSDILALLDHNRERGVLARYCKGEGSLSLEVDERGLKYRFEAPHTALGDEVIEGLKRGDIRSSSFAFRVGEDKWERNSSGLCIRTIKSFKGLYDVSMVYNPAYEEANVELKSFDEFKAEEHRQHIKEYYENKRNSLK